MTTRHVAKQGETVPGIAARFGFADYRVVYDAPGNAALKQRRPDPNVLAPGDVVEIPDAAPKEVAGRSGQAHLFRVDVRPQILRLVLRDHAHAPLAGVSYLISFEGGADSSEGSTDAGGKLEAPLPLGARSATLEVLGRSYTLLVGHLDPLHDAPDGGVGGLQARLRNLRYYSGPIDGIAGPATRIALGIFQHDHQLPADGEPGDATLRKVEEIHGS